MEALYLYAQLKTPDAAKHSTWVVKAKGQYPQNIGNIRWSFKLSEYVFYPKPGPISYLHLRDVVIILFDKNAEWNARKITAKVESK